MAIHTKDAWKFCTLGDGELSAMTVSATLTPVYFAVNSALGK